MAGTSSPVVLRNLCDATPSMARAVVLAITAACSGSGEHVSVDAAHDGIDASADATVDVPSGPVRLRIVSWNLAHNMGGVAAQANHLELQSPDVILVQETTVENAAALATELGTSWRAVGFASNTPEAVAVLTRMTLAGSETRVIGNSSWSGDRVAVRLRVSVSGREVDVFGTHLDWPMSGTWSDTGEHAVGRDAFLAWLDTFPGAKIYGGDLNAHSSGNAVQQATITAFDARGTDSCLIHGTHAYCDTTFPTRSSRLDHVYRSSTLTTVSHAVVDHAGLSDHKLVVADFDVP